MHLKRTSPLGLDVDEDQRQSLDLTGSGYPGLLQSRV